MTREEAIKNLEALLLNTNITDAYGDIEDMTPYEDAVNIVIKVLEEWGELLENMWAEIVDNSSNLKGPYDISFHRGIRLHDLEKIFDKYVEILKKEGD